MDYILKDEGYAEGMDATVLPYLKERMSETYLERESGKKIYVAKYTQDDPKGLVLVCHGFTESTVKYRENIYYLLKAGYCVVMPDHCGHGYSYRLVDDLSLVHVDSWRRYADDFLFVADWAMHEFPGLTPYLFAHSMGGGVGACLEVLAPTLFRKAVLSSPMIRPLTGPIPFKIAYGLAKGKRQKGKGDTYASGQKPYSGIIPFEKSVTNCLQRYMYYEKIRKEEPLFQTAACSFGWVAMAGDLTEFLHREANKIVTPTLVFQAGADVLVSPADQAAFVEKVNAAHPGTARLEVFPGIKHEIFNSTYDTVKDYWGRVFAFLAE